MEWQQILTDLYGRTSREMERVLDGLSTDEMNQQPTPDCNSISWLAWHTTRGQDRTVSELIGEEQVWIKDGWYEKFNRPADPADTGFGHSLEDLAAFKAPDSQTLIEYNRAVLERMQNYINTLSAADLDKEMGNPVFPTVGALIVGILTDGLQHIGQAAYVRGLLKGKGWSAI